MGREAAAGVIATTLKAAGYDGLIITGAAQQPVILYVVGRRLELRDASHVWAKAPGPRRKVSACERAGHRDAKIGCIGPAGEHLVRAAMLVNDYNHSAAHGLGAVMGSKKLKAIVAWGTERPQYYDKLALIDAGERWKVALTPRISTVAKRKKSVGHREDWETLTKYNWRSTLIADENKGFDQNRVTLRPCFQCPRLCPWDVEIGEESARGKVGHFNAGSEWMDTFYNLGFKGNDVLYLSLNESMI